MKKSLVEQANEIVDRKNIDRGFEIGDRVEVVELNTDKAFTVAKVGSIGEVIEIVQTSRNYSYTLNINGNTESFESKDLQLKAKLPKLRAGDHVKVLTQTSTYDGRPIHTGKVGTIDAIIYSKHDEVFEIRINEIDNRYYFTEDELEKVDESTECKTTEDVVYPIDTGEMAEIMDITRGALYHVLHNIVPKNKHFKRTRNKENGVSKYAFTENDVAYFKRIYKLKSDGMKNDEVTSLLYTNELILSEYDNDNDNDYDNATQSTTTPPKTSIVKSLNVNGVIYHVGDTIILNVNDVGVINDMSYTKLVGVSELSIELSELNVDNIKDVIDKIGIDKVGEPHE